MTISLWQGIIIGLWTGFCLSGQLLGIYTNRSLVLALGVGVILGDVPTALAMGAVSEIAFMGFGVGAGGTVPPNQLGPGIIGTLMAITLKSSGMAIDAALALSFPFAVAFQFVITATYTFLSGNSSLAKKALEKGNYKKFKFLSNATYLSFIVVGFIIGFGSAMSVEGAAALINTIPMWLIKGFTVAGSMLPAIGFAMILNVMVKKEYIAFVVLGFVCVSYLKLPVIGIAFMSLVFALYDYYNKPAAVVVGDNTLEEEDFKDGI
ncbi:PTS system mannose/fructose/sorbose family transporter subunit IIC [Clostridium putrefaciens]|uniref:PTS system mannose/fructose/sorbose family transporter subunit IIC n=1 Tax=Clostridium putrefaciens TaxID=99675 RepID=A0A381J7P8_9CLOT|nr:PTS sugar transporter subunit IIC [Clostridium putrefaciens]SUY46300.1 PTS system mannose/fructose/sorbose family transporter subunit IIC [Clostridium putrefaciens]